MIVIFFGVSVLQFAAFDAQAQMQAANAYKGEITIFVDDNAIIANVNAIKGNISFIYKNKKQTDDTDIKTQYKTVAQNSGFEQTTLEKNNVRKQKTHKKTVFSPLPPFGNAAFMNSCMAGNAVLPVQSNFTYKLFSQKFTQIFFTPIFDYTSKYFSNNNFVLQGNDSFACAHGNLPPPC
ncbi:MAG: hypothetical protein FWF72_07000 [Paludibacter sp.]|nr:hypothetical protein [Paludibacter sp.]